MILVVIHRTEYLDHLASAVMIAIGCATVAATAGKPLLTDTTAGTNAAIAVAISPKFCESLMMQL